MLQWNMCLHRNFHFAPKQAKLIVGSVSKFIAQTDFIFSSAFRYYNEVVCMYISQTVVWKP